MSLEDIQKEFQIKLEAQQDEEKRRELELEKERAISGFYAAELQRKERESWVKTALTEFPDANPAELAGDNEQSVKAKAKESHERFQSKLQERLEAEKKRMEEAMGRAAWGGNAGGNSGAPAGTPDPKAEVENIYQAIREEKLTPYQEKRLRELRLGPMFERMAKDIVGAA